MQRAQFLQAIYKKINIISINLTATHCDYIQIKFYVWCNN